MKNLTSLLIVAGLLIVLGCKCQSDLFDKEKRTVEVNVSTPASTTPASSPAATPKRTPEATSTTNRESSYKYLKTGTYTGRATNSTYKKGGDLMLRIDSVDAAGKVEAYFRASNGLAGSATMTGEIDETGKLMLDGTLDDGRAVSVSATVAGSKIDGGYGIADDQLNTESGSFTVTRK